MYGFWFLYFKKHAKFREVLKLVYGTVLDIQPGQAYPPGWMGPSLRLLHLWFGEDIQRDPSIGVPHLIYPVLADKPPFQLLLITHGISAVKRPLKIRGNIAWKSSGSKAAWHLPVCAPDCEESPDVGGRLGGLHLLFWIRDHMASTVPELTFSRCGKEAMRKGWWRGKQS